MNKNLNIIKMIPVLAGVIFFLSCKNDIEAVKKITSIETFPTMEAENITFLRSDSGRIAIKAVSPLVREFAAAKEPYTEFPQGLKAEFLDREQNVTSSVSANYVIHKTEEQKWIARYNVEVIDKDGRIINTEYMVFDEKKGMFFSDQFTKFKDKDAIIYGKGFESNIDLSNATILNPTGEFYVDEEQYKN